MIETLSYSLSRASPIELDVVWKELLHADFEYPSWIKHVHELQNWYYWTHGKKELDTSRVPIEEGEDNINYERFFQVADTIFSERRKLTEPDMFGYEGVDLERPYILK